MKRIMLITGTSRGIGEKLANHFSKKGFFVIGCSRKPANLNLKNYRHFCLDIADEQKVREMFIEIRKTYGRLDFLINNAGIYASNFVALTPLQTVQNVFKTNFIGTFLCCREAIKIMQINKYGRIINVSSVAVKLASPGSSIYSSSKAAVEQFSKVLAKEVSNSGITINILALSFAKDGGITKIITQELINKTLKITGAGAIVDTKKIINAINFIIAPKNSLTTAQIIRI